MNATRSVVFEIELSSKERQSLKRLLDLKTDCSIDKRAKLFVEVTVPLEKLPEPEAQT